MKKLLVGLTFMSLLSSQSFALDCDGRSSHWSAKITDKLITLDSGDRFLIPITRTGSAGVISQDIIKTYSDSRGPVATVIKGSCSNGSSDIHVYPKQVIIYTSTDTHYGCCGKPVIVER